jgi:hypothetical protein
MQRRHKVIFIEVLLYLTWKKSNADDAPHWAHSTFLGNLFRFLNLNLNPPLLHLKIKIKIRIKIKRGTQEYEMHPPAFIIYPSPKNSP